MALTRWERDREAQRIATLKRSAARKERDNKRSAIGDLWKADMKEAKEKNDQLHVDANNEYKEDMAEINAWYLDQVEGAQR